MKLEELHKTLLKEVTSVIGEMNEIKDFEEDTYSCLNVNTFFGHFKDVGFTFKDGETCTFNVALEYFLDEDDNYEYYGLYVSNVPTGDPYYVADIFTESISGTEYTSKDLDKAIKEVKNIFNEMLSEGSFS